MRDSSPYADARVIADAGAPMFMPARTLLPFLRHTIGEGVVHPIVLLAHTVLLAFVVPIVAAVGWGIADGREPGFAWLTIYGLAYLGLGLVVWVRRRRGLTRGEDIHDGDLGRSWLADALPLPLWLSEVVILPGLVIGVGHLATRTTLVVLGYWLMLAGASLALLGGWEARVRRALYRNMVNDQLFARSHEQYHQTYGNRGQSRAGRANAPGDDEFMAGGA